ncbi:MAG: hypothetical protein IKE94_16205, partial [Aeriscardovia sp.]|nr:hypothetical protein [Aeriscardovia sp.]
FGIQSEAKMYPKPFNSIIRDTKTPLKTPQKNKICPFGIFQHSPFQKHPLQQKTAQKICAALSIL